jgi:hypothetical protein
MVVDGIGVFIPRQDRATFFFLDKDRMTRHSIFDKREFHNHGLPQNSRDGSPQGSPAHSAA